MSKSYNTLRFFYVDQLSFDLPTFEGIQSKEDLLVFFESLHEMTFVKHHPKKLAFWLASMRHFAEECKKRGYQVLYEPLDLKRKERTITEFLKQVIQEYGSSELIVTEPSEYRQREELLSADLKVKLQLKEDSRFFCTKPEFKTWSEGKKQLVMEFFYRQMRKKTGLLMESGKPIGGEWNYDKENRKTLNQDLFFIPPKTFQNDSITQEVVQLIEEHFSEHFGDVEPFFLATTRSQALEALDHFVTHSLPLFGDYQDCMLDGEPFLFHSHLSQYLNIGLLNPLEICLAAEKAFQDQQAPLNAVEGFIRQILGWREFVRGIYWLYMPSYADQNFLKNKRALPSFYWTGQTKMRCLKQVILQTRQYAQSHHIQRLMVSGNFALLMGVIPEEICKWYLEVYLDAYDWVELPNTLGMAMFADGGVLGTKPYAASGNYINKMSNFCQHCSYKVKEKVGEDACPFNYLYWNFLIENKKVLENNRRMAFAYKNLANKSPAEIKAIKQSSQNFFDEVNS